MRLTLTAALAALVFAGAATASGPYAGWQDRPIKALSAQQMEDLRAGRGMSLALAAELNGYPGPRHVLDLAEALDLTPAQKAETEALFTEMQARASALGTQVLAAEQRLDRLFAEGTADPDGVRALTAELGALQGSLRYTHLHYHLRMKGLLDASQVAAYDRLRGYHGVAPGGHGSHSGHNGHGDGRHGHGGHGHGSH